MIRTAVYYTNVRDKVNGEKEILNQYQIERIEILSKKTERWYLKKEKYQYEKIIYFQQSYACC